MQQTTLEAEDSTRALSLLVAMPGYPHDTLHPVWQTHSHQLILAFLFLQDFLHQGGGFIPLGRPMAAILRTTFLLTSLCMFGGQTYLFNLFECVRNLSSIPTPLQHQLRLSQLFAESLRIELSVFSANNLSFNKCHFQTQVFVTAHQCCLPLCNSNRFLGSRYAE